MKLLINLNLILVACLLTIAILGWGTQVWEAHVWWREAKANELEWRACETKHDLLKRVIKKEGLWRRLGMAGQPWLQ